MRFAALAPLCYDVPLKNLCAVSWYLILAVGIGLILYVILKKREKNE